MKKLIQAIILIIVILGVFYWLRSTKASKQANRSTTRPYNSHISQHQDDNETDHTIRHPEDMDSTHYASDHQDSSGPSGKGTQIDQILKRSSS